MLLIHMTEMESVILSEGRDLTSPCDPLPHPYSKEIRVFSGLDVRRYPRTNSHACDWRERWTLSI